MSEEKKKSFMPVVLGILALILVGALVFYFVGGGDDDSDKEDSTPEVSFDLFLDNIKEGNFDYVDEATSLGDEIAFEAWDEIKNANVREIYYESDDIALVRVDFDFTKDIEGEDPFEYPLTLVFVLEEDEDGVWSISGVEYDLQRYRAAMGEEEEVKEDVDEEDDEEEDEEEDEDEEDLE